MYEIIYKATEGETVTEHCVTMLGLTALIVGLHEGGAVVQSVSIV